MDAIKAYLLAPVPRWLALTAIVSTGVVAASGTYVSIKQRLEKEYDDRLEAEVRETREFYLISAEKESTPEELVEAKRAAIKEMSSGSKLVEQLRYPVPAMEEDVTEEPATRFRNVWDEASKAEFNIDEEAEARASGNPYILSKAEFQDGEYATAAVTYFEEDGVLADQKNKDIPDVDAIVGESNLERFGYGSGDPAILYVRNERLETDFEIFLDKGSYSEKILGVSLTHSDEPGLRRFRINRAD